MRKATWLIMIIAAFSFAFGGCDLLGGGDKKPAENTSTDEDKDEDKDDDEDSDEDSDEDKDDAEDEDEDKDEDKDEEEDKDDAKDEDDKEEGDEKKEEEAELPSRVNYIEATVAIGCTDLDTSMDAGQKTEKRKEILAKYGFTTETYDKAQAKYKDDPTVKPVVSTRVTNEACKKPEVKEVVKEDEKEKEKPKIGYGTFTGSVKGGGVRGTIQLVIKPNKLAGNAKGTRNGEKWNTGLSGSAKGATFSGSGSNKNTSLRISGRISGKTASGNLSGKINSKSASMSFTASRR